MNRPRQNKRDHPSDSRKNSFLRGVKIEKAIAYVKAVLSIAAHALVGALSLRNIFEVTQQATRFQGMTFQIIT